MISVSSSSSRLAASSLRLVKIAPMLSLRRFDERLSPVRRRSYQRSRGSSSSAGAGLGASPATGGAAVSAGCSGRQRKRAKKPRFSGSLMTADAR